uniref:Uncharacterized protein n=1 Tax=Romanomermis culicivorax TaxID=13658 RepID=A0A915KE68_ROMCU
MSVSVLEDRQDPDDELTQDNPSMTALFNCFKIMEIAFLEPATINEMTVNFSLCFVCKKVRDYLELGIILLIATRPRSLRKLRLPKL